LQKKDSITIYHQKICGAGNKTNELIISLHPNRPDIVCIMEHHLNEAQIEHTYTDNYNVGAKYIRTENILTST
jgi:hypothetical protein